MKDFDEAIDRIVAGLEKKRVMSAKEREIVAYHESGHAIVASVLPGARSGAQDLDRRSAASARWATRCSCRSKTGTC
jgi:ATP-dependent Zn protease